MKKVNRVALQVMTRGLMYVGIFMIIRSFIPDQSALDVPLKAFEASSAGKLCFWGAMSLMVGCVVAMNRMNKMLEDREGKS